MRSFCRRNFLQAMGLSAAAAPFLPYFDREAEAQDNGFPRRLLLIFTGNGTLADQYWPTGTETNFTFGAGSITEPLAPFKSKLLFPKNLRRLTSGSGAHEKNMGGLWTCSKLVATNGYPTGPSVDQVIAREIKAGLAFDSLQFGVQCDSFNTGGNKPVLKSMTYSGSNAVLTPEDNPIAMFEKLMLGNVGGPTPPTGPSAEDLARIRAQKQSVIDAVRGDLNSLRSRIDSDDRYKLDQHLQGIADIEKRISQPMNPGGTISGCVSPGAPSNTLADPAARKLNQNFPAILDIQNKLAVAALACNRTRVASVQWSRAFSPIVHEWVDVHSDHHTISHKSDADSIGQLHRLNRWYGERFADLLRQLDSVREGNGTLLDNTVVIWGNEAATGQHDASTAVFVMAGSCGGKLKTGRLVDATGYDWSQLLITVCHAMGATSVTTLGDLGMKGGDIPSLLA
jgi:Protein of unknown function (DUF1552)